MATSNYSPAARAAIASQAGFSTPLVAQTIADVAGSIVAGGIGAAAGGWDTAPNRDTSITTMTEIKTVLNGLAADLAAMGLPITVS